MACGGLGLVALLQKFLKSLTIPRYYHRATDIPPWFIFSSRNWNKEGSRLRGIISHLFLFYLIYLTSIGNWRQDLFFNIRLLLCNIKLGMILKLRTRELRLQKPELLGRRRAWFII